MKTSIRLLTLLLAGLTASPQNPSIVSSASGSGELNVGNEIRVFAFSAQKHGVGNTTGQVQLTNRTSGVISHSTINCLSISGNVATMSGTITSSNNPNVPVGDDIWFQVADNGEGAGTPPDQITLLAFFEPPGPTCSENIGLSLRSIEAGNITVK